MRHTSKRPRSRSNLPTVAESAEQSQEESQQQQQQQLQESRSLLSTILSRRSNSQRNNLAPSSSASAPQNDNGGSGTEAAQGKRKRALSFLPRRRSSQKSGLTASSAPQPNEVGHHEPAPVNNDVVAPTSLPSSPTTPRLLGGLSRLPSSASQLCRHLCKTAGKLPNVLPRRRRADGDDSHPLLDEDEAEEAMLNEDYPRIEIDDPLHVDGFFRPDERGRIRAIVPPRNKDDDPVVSIRFTLTGVITRHVAPMDYDSTYRPRASDGEAATNKFIVCGGFLPPLMVEAFLREGRDVLSLNFTVPTTIIVYGCSGFDSDVRDDDLVVGSEINMAPPPSMHIQQLRSGVLNRLTSAFVKQCFKTRHAVVKYEMGLTVVWQSSCGTRTMRRTANAGIFVQPRAPTAALHTIHEEGPPLAPNRPMSVRRDVRNVKAILDIIPGRSQPEDHRGRQPWNRTNVCVSHPMKTRLLTLGDSQDSPRRLAHFFDGRARGDAAMTLTTDGLAAFVTGQPCRFTFGITLPDGTRLVPNDDNGNLRMNVMRTVWTRKHGFHLHIQRTSIMASLQGRSAVQSHVSHGVPRPRDQHDRPYKHYWSGHFVIEPYMLPAHSFNESQPPLESRDTRTVPSFSFKGTHVRYDLLIQIDTEIPTRGKSGFVIGSGNTLTWQKSGVLFRANNIPVANSAGLRQGQTEQGEPEAEAVSPLVPPRYRARSVRPGAEASTSAQWDGTERESRSATPLPAYSPTEEPNFNQVEAARRRRWTATAGLPTGQSRPTSANSASGGSLLRRALRNSAGNAQQPGSSLVTPSMVSIFSWVRRENAPTRSQSHASSRSSESERRATSSEENVATSSTAQARAADASYLCCATTPSTLPATPERSDEEEDQTLDRDGPFGNYHAADEPDDTSERMPADGIPSSAVSETGRQPEAWFSSRVPPALLNFELRHSAAVPASDALPTTPGRSPGIVQQQDQERNRNEEEEAAALSVNVGEPGQASTATTPNMKSSWSPDTPAAGTPQQQPDQSLSTQPSIVSLGDAAENDNATAETSARVAALPRPPQLFVDAAEAFALDQDQGSALPAAPHGSTATPDAPECITVTQPTPERGMTAAAGTERVWPNVPQHQLVRTAAPEGGSSGEAEERVMELAS